MTIEATQQPATEQAPEVSFQDTIRAIVEAIDEGRPFDLIHPAGKALAIADFTA